MPFDILGTQYRFLRNVEIITLVHVPVGKHMFKGSCHNVNAETVIPMLRELPLDMSLPWIRNNLARYGPRLPKGNKCQKNMCTEE